MFTISKKRKIVLLLTVLFLILNSSLFSFNKTKTRETHFVSMNCSSFSFYGWLQPYTIEKGKYPGNDLLLVKHYGVGNEFISLAYFFDCVDNYYRCAINYIREVFVPYLYRCELFYYDKIEGQFSIKYPEILSGTATLSCKVKEDLSRIGVYSIFTQLNKTKYYLDTERLYFNILPRSVFLIDPDTELSNTQYSFNEEPLFVMENNFGKFRFNQLTYKNFHLYFGKSDSRIVSFIRVNRSVKGARIFLFLDGEGIARSFKGFVDVEFHHGIETLSNRFTGLEYYTQIYWKAGEFKGNDESEIRKRYTFVVGPNTVIYLKDLEVRR